MINKTENPAEWALLMFELLDAKEHLGNLIELQMDSEDFSEQEFRIALAHIYSHLNRAWNVRKNLGELTPEQFDSFAQFPEDIEPL